MAIRSSWSEPQVSSQSCFCWLYRASPSLAAKNIVNLISVLTIWRCPRVESSLMLLERMFAMTNVFSWKNPVSLCSASFWTPRPNWSIFSGIFLLLQSYPLWWKGCLSLVYETAKGISHQWLKLCFYIIHTSGFFYKESYSVGNKTLLNKQILIPRWTSEKTHQNCLLFIVNDNVISLTTSYNLPLT